MATLARRTCRTPRSRDGHRNSSRLGAPFLRSTRRQLLGSIAAGARPAKRPLSRKVDRHCDRPASAAALYFMGAGRLSSSFRHGFSSVECRPVGRNGSQRAADLISPATPRSTAARRPCRPAPARARRPTGASQVSPAPFLGTPPLAYDAVVTALANLAVMRPAANLYRLRRHERQQRRPVHECARPGACAWGMPRRRAAPGVTPPRWGCPQLLRLRRRTRRQRRRNTSDGVTDVASACHR